MYVPTETEKTRSHVKRSIMYPYNNVLVQYSDFIFVERPKLGLGMTL